MQSPTSASVDRLLGRSPFERHRAPEPTLLPHLARLGQRRPPQRLCTYAELFGRGITVPSIPWPDLENATISTVVYRLEESSDIKNLWQEHASVITFLPDSMLPEAAEDLQHLDDADSERSRERLARLIARQPDLLNGRRLAALHDEAGSLSAWQAARTLPWLAIASRGAERDALVLQLAELREFDLVGLAALLPHLTDDQQARLFRGGLDQALEAYGDSAYQLALWTQFLPFVRGDVFELMLFRAANLGRKFLGERKWLPEWMMALVVNRLARLPEVRARDVAELLLETLEEPWRQQIRSYAEKTVTELPFADVLLVQPGSDYLFADDSGVKESGVDVEETLDRIIVEWGGAPAATGQRQGGDSVAAPSTAPPISGGFFDLVSKGMHRVREVFAGRDGEEMASSAPREDSGGGSGDKPPRDVYALLNCPDKVKPMEEFTVTLGISAKATPGVTGGPLSMPDPDIAPFKLEITLVSDGFMLRPGETNKITLDVTAADPYPSRDLHLRGVAGDPFRPARALMAHYSIGGQLIGSASRPIEVSEAIASGATTNVSGFDFSMPPGVPVPDMTIAITEGNTVGEDRLIWSILTRHEDIDVNIPPKEADYKSNIGSQPEAWARNFMNSVNANRDDKPLEPLMIGSGKKVRKQMPVWVRRKLLELWQKFDGSDKRPTVLIVSAEPHIPWELAYLRLDLNKEIEGFFGAEFVVGRWVIGYEDVSGRWVPTYPPPTAITVKSMVVVTGDYSKTKNWNNLNGAQQEAKNLVSSYHAIKVDADNQLASWLKNEAKADLIHFAVHGNWSLSGNKDGIVLTDGTTLTAEEVGAASFKQEPFIFLNACQLGQGDRTLGDYGGIAAAFLEAGASGVVASLWNVDDTQACELAVDFYKQIKTNNAAPGELLRRERSKYKKNTKSKLSLAYQFFGHPHMRMKIDLP